LSVKSEDLWLMYGDLLHVMCGVCEFWILIMKSAYI